MGRTLTIYTPEVIRSIPIWIEQGLSPEDIAERIGTTVGSLKTSCSRHRIALRSKQRKVDAIFSGKAELVFRFPISRRALQTLRHQAARRGLAADALAGILIETIANDDLYAAVLDDEG